MSDQFDLEQDIMSCWNVTTDLNVLLEELMENDQFTTDQASNFVLGLQTIYEAKFNKLFRTFESFLKEYYRMRDDLKHMQAELEEFQDAKYSSDEALELVEDEESEF